MGDWYVFGWCQELFLQREYRKGPKVLWLIECTSPRLSGCRWHQQPGQQIRGNSHCTNLILALVYFRLAKLSASGNMFRSVQSSTMDGSIFIPSDMGTFLPQYNTLFPIFPSPLILFLVTKSRTLNELPYIPLC